MIKTGAIVLIVFGLFGCKTYYIPIENLKNNLAR
jgi:hypothetical protein